MKILLVSDSHGNNTALDRLALLYPNMDLYLHAGDSEATSASIYPFHSVLGNCDYYGDFPMFMELPFPGGKLYMEHRPNINIAKLKDKGVTLYLYGHTHRRDDREIDGIRIINPGAISFARDDNYLSYALIEVTKEKIDVTFKTLDD